MVVSTTVMGMCLLFASGAIGRLETVSNRTTCSVARATTTTTTTTTTAATAATAGEKKPADARQWFQITVVDAATGRGVPLVELRMVNGVRYVTDSAGIVAFHEPGLMNTVVYFGVRSHGYEFSKDGFGYRGARVRITPGGKVVLKVHRKNIAQRLYRITGAGIYRDSVLLGKKVPIRKPLLNAQVFGSDSVVNAVYHGRIYWFWGDTNRPSYPLGNFHVPGATSRLPATADRPLKHPGLDPDVGVNLSYFVGRDGFARPTAQMPGAGPTWINGLVVLKDKTGRERMFAKYVKVKKPMVIYRRGLVEFDDGRKSFLKRMSIPLDAPLYPSGHPFHHVDQGVEYVYFPNPFPVVRVRATAEALQDLSRYEAFTCLKAGSRESRADVVRDSSGKLQYAWRPNTPPLTRKVRRTLITRHKLGANEGAFRLRDVQSGKPLSAHGGSVYWNAYRKRWVMILLEAFGTSPLGEIWYAEADTPLGPWMYARKIVTHDRYSFYNPKQHPMFDKAGGRIIFFEGTYTTTFSGNPDPTPRYNYNQIMYKLDLADPRLTLPVPVYAVPMSGPNESKTRMDRFVAHRPSTVQERAATYHWLACDRPSRSTIPIYQARTRSGAYRLTRTAPQADNNRPAAPLFYALRPTERDSPATTAILYEHLDTAGRRRVYSIDKTRKLPGTWRRPHALCRVWKKPAF